jgi:hypothetical protein
MIHNQFEHLFGEIHTRSIGDTFNAERHGISSGWNHEFRMIRFPSAKEIANLHTGFMTGHLPGMRHECATSEKDSRLHISAELPGVVALGPCLHRNDDKE